MAAPTREEFQAWAQNPVSQWVFRGARAASEAQKAHWNELSWESGKADPLELCELRTRSDAYLALVETGYEDWCSIQGDEPKES